jgi:hypothetical protein
MTELLMLPEKKLTYHNGRLIYSDGQLSPHLFYGDPNYESPEEKQKKRQEKEAQEKRFKETYKKLYANVKHVTITFKDGHIAILDLKDRDYGWRIKWSTRDLLRQAVIPKKLGFDEYGTRTKQGKGFRMIEQKRVTVTANMTLEERIKLCHSRIPGRRHIVGFSDSNLIAPLPIWSPVPAKYSEGGNDSFSIWGLEAQDPKYLPEILKTFVRLEPHGKGHHEHLLLMLLPGAYKNGES